MSADTSARHTRRRTARRTRGLRWLPRVTWGLVAVSALAASSAYAATLSLASKPLTTLKTCVLTATPATSTVAIDSEVRQASASSNFGTTSAINVASGVSVNRRGYLRFDLTRCSPAIPSNASVKRATLRLFVTTLPAVCRTHDIFRVTAPWTETGITWNNQPFGTTINNPASAQRTSSLDVGVSPCQNSTNNQYVSGWDVTADVRAFVAGTATNNGWMIRDNVEGSATTRTGTYASKNSGTLATSPQLVVNYVT